MFAGKYFVIRITWFFKSNYSVKGRELRRGRIARNVGVYMIQGFGETQQEQEDNAVTTLAQDFTTSPEYNQAKKPGCYTDNHNEWFGFADVSVESPWRVQQLDRFEDDWSDLHFGGFKT